MFERLLSCGIESFMLKVQYRMLPSIRQFPSDRFYQGKLVDAQNVVERVLEPRLQKVKDELNLYHTMFFDLKYASEVERSKSKQNPDEANFIARLVYLMSKSAGDLRGKIGIITPYKQQKLLIKNFL